MTATAPALEDLRQQLHDLRAAVAAHDDLRATALVMAHDGDLRRYLDAHGTVEHAALAELLQQQNAAMAEMRAHRDAAAQALRSGRRSSQAARAYLRAGAL